jgi:DNA-binding transcriptional ArsR family regulator
MMETQTDQLSNTFAALADPTRRAILAKLALGEASVTELAKPFNMSMPAVSKHLKVLERAGLVAHGREAQWRPRRLEANALKEVADWVEHYRQFWEQRLDRLDDYLRELQKEKGFKSEKHKNEESENEESENEKPATEKKHVRKSRNK